MPQMNDPFALQVCVEGPWPGRLLLLLPPIALSAASFLFSFLLNGVASQHLCKIGFVVI
jgi:hypothetical protein